ncbi:MAG: protein-L-isoaspartate(D-aspartate) O-methyltransferase [Planctomycetota bacterium]
MGDATIKRERLVDLLKKRGIRHPDVLAAMRAIPRERFVDEGLRAKAYADGPLPIGENQTISQPWIVARMSELAEPDGSGRVLEIGTGSGYQAAILSSLFEQVYTVERIESLSVRARKTVRDLGLENVHFKIFDGSYGWSEFAPYRAIVVTAGAPDLPKPLWDQLEEGGSLVVPVGGPSREQDQLLLRYLKRGGQPVRENHGGCRFVPLLGKFGWKA